MQKTQIEAQTGAQTEEKPQAWICGFWRRIIALFIDTILLGVVGLLLGSLFESFLVELGGLGRVLGFIISISYFGVMNSSLANGQTIGKKLLKIKVVDAQNACISLPKSLLRYSFLAVPFSLNGAQFSNQVLLSYWIYPLSFIVFGGLFSIFYLYVFNRNTRQSLHDLLTGTYVVNCSAPVQTLPAVWKTHLVVVTGIFIVATLIPLLTSALVQSTPFKEMLVIQEAITNNSAVKYAGVAKGSSTFTNDTGTQSSTFINSETFLNENRVKDAGLARDLAQTIMATYPDAINYHSVNVTLNYGYDIGISEKWHSQVHRFDPKQLK